MIWLVFQWQWKFWFEIESSMKIMNYITKPFIQQYIQQYGPFSGNLMTTQFLWNDHMWIMYPTSQNDFLIRLFPPFFF